ncbi:MAG: hypothetical protein KDK96_10500 [Chlamydiia bacterium]|nr:hypothetical protein [Chlamydiia bacterium]
MTRKSTSYHQIMTCIGNVSQLFATKNQNSSYARKRKKGQRLVCLNRKNAYFFKNETGAKIGDVLLSVIETCALNATNTWEYLVAIQEYQN